MRLLVTGCDGCPFNYDSVSCSAVDSSFCEPDLHDFITTSPDWCPLKSGPVVVALRKPPDDYEMPTSDDNLAGALDFQRDMHRGPK